MAHLMLLTGWLAACAGTQAEQGRGPADQNVRALFSHNRYFAFYEEAGQMQMIGDSAAFVETATSSVDVRGLKLNSGAFLK